MSIKVGDICKPTSGVCSAFNGTAGAKKVKITSIDSRSLANSSCRYQILDQHNESIGSCSCYRINQLEKISNKKAKPVKFVAIDIANADRGEFTSRVVLNEWLAKLQANRNRVNWDEIHIFEVKKQLEVSAVTRIQLKAI